MPTAALRIPRSFSISARATGTLDAALISAPAFALLSRKMTTLVSLGSSLHAAAAATIASISNAQFSPVSSKVLISSPSAAFFSKAENSFPSFVKNATAARPPSVVHASD